MYFIKKGIRDIGIVLIPMSELNLITKQMQILIGQ